MTSIVLDAGALIALERRDERLLALAKGLLRSHAGRLLAAIGTHDVLDGHVALLARRLNATVPTSDVEDLAALVSSLTLVRV